MTMGMPLAVPEVNPLVAWDIVCGDAAARLVDVRTRPEWGFVGGPDLSEIGQTVLCVEWKCYPDMVVNPDFPGQVQQALKGQLPSQLLFICRSGVRSMQAAQAMSDAYAAQGKDIPCINVAEGFEGDLNLRAHRGGLNGWKARGLAWRQT